MITRRKMIGIMGAVGAGGLLYSPARKLFEKIARDKLVNTKSFFKPRINSNRNYVQVNLYGAPSRNGFDSLLKPYDNSGFIANPLVANRILDQGLIKNGLLKMEYSVEKIYGINVPYQWHQLLPTPSGKLKPMSDLLENAMMIRGCRLDFEGHPINGIQQISPIQGGLSLNGIIGDSSTGFISAISVGNTPVSRAFKSNGSLLLEVPVDEENYAEYILKPFLIKDAEYLLNQKNLDNEFNEIAKNYPSDLRDLLEVKKQSIKYVQSNIDMFIDQFSALTLKYHSLIERAIETIDYIPKVATPKFPLIADGKKTLKEMVGIYSSDDLMFLGDDLLSFLKTGKINYWAQEFALCEFLLTNNICQSILISPPLETGFLIESCDARQAIPFENLECSFDPKINKSTVHLKGDVRGGGRKHSFKMDAHSTGIALDVMSTSLFYRAISTCLLELTESLKLIKVGNSNMFNETVIHLASEFDRIPSVDGYGSSHLPVSNPTTIFSGCIKGPMVLGNIYVGTLEKNKEEYYGTVGVGAPIKELGDSIKIGNVSSTLSTLLRVKPIVKRNKSLIDEISGNFVSNIEQAANVEGIC